MYVLSEPANVSSAWPKTTGKDGTPQAYLCRKITRDRLGHYLVKLRLVKPNVDECQEWGMTGYVISKDLVFPIEKQQVCYQPVVQGLSLEDLDSLKGF